jgi:hypothetical protein
MRIARSAVIACSIVLSLSAAGAAALASPAPHSSTDKQANAAARSDLINLATDEEVYLTDVATHYGSFNQLSADGLKVHVSRGVQLVIVHVDGSTGYCLRAEQGDDGYREFYDSGAGGLRHAGCSAVTKGPSGGVRNGLPTALVRSMVKALAVGQETYLTDHMTYGSVKQLRRAGDAPTLGHGVRLAVLWYDGSNSFCLKGTQRTSPFWYDSRHGAIDHACGLRPKAAKSGGSY